MKKLSLLFALLSFLSLSACAGGDMPVTGGVDTEDGTISVSGGDTVDDAYVVENDIVFADELYSQELADRVRDRVFFSFDESKLEPKAIETLKAQVKWLKENPDKKITIEGHCDERGTREYNLALGDRRATAIKTYMLSQGIPANRIKTISYGKERPAILGANEAAWAQNRRGVTIIRE